VAEDGCLTYTRGIITITITDRPRLLAHACNGHDVIRRATDVAMGAR
jgi:hypothetical protein